jgi:hypothetical protein
MTRTLSAGDEGLCVGEQVPYVDCVILSGAKDLG